MYIPIQLSPDLKNAAVHRGIKPQILSTIGDVALSVGSNFTKYLPVVFQILQEAAQLNVTFNKVCSLSGKSCNMCSLWEKHNIYACVGQFLSLHLSTFHSSVILCPASQ